MKHFLWHGNAEEALERLGDLIMELSLIQARSAAAKKVADNLSEFQTYIDNNREFIPNFGERSPVREEAEDAVDATRSTPDAADSDEGPQ